MTFGQTKRPLLLFCLSISALLHLGAIWIFYLHPLYIDSGPASAAMKPSASSHIATKDDVDLLVEKVEQALGESLNTTIALSHPPADSIAKQSDSTIETMQHQAPSAPFASSPTIRDEELALCSSQEPTFSMSMPPLFDPETEANLSDFALDPQLDSPPFTYESEKVASVDFTHQCYQAEPLPPPEVDDIVANHQSAPSALSPREGDTLTTDFIASLEKLHIQADSAPCEELSEEKMFSTFDEGTTPKLILPNAVDYLRSQWVKGSLPQRKLPCIEHYGLSEIVTNIEWEDNLELDVAVMPSQTPNQYVFSITVHPELISNTSTMKQNFYFAIDRSSSIEKLKFSRFKRAVQRSLCALQEGDSFNIYIFDKQTSKLSNGALPVTPKTIQMAEEFLEGQSSKTHFAATEIYTSLEEMLPKHYDPNELHSVILITDGNTLLNSSQQKQAIARWSEKYGGDVNFYAAAAGKGNNLVLLDILSYTTAGKLLYSDTNAGFPRKLVRLVKDLHNPIVKNISVDLQAKDPQARIALYPKKNQLPPMFANQPYTIIGTIDELCDLTLHIQGRNRDKWLNIHKTLSLAKGATPSRSLERLWASTQSRICYDHFLKNGKASHLKEAVQIVAPYRGVIASEQ